MNNYIYETIYGVPKPLRKGHNTSPNSRRVGKEYVHRVLINGSKYYKVHVKRQGVSKIKYFKKMRQAKLFVSIMRENRSI